MTELELLIDQAVAERAIAERTYLITDYGRANATRAKAKATARRALRAARG